MVLNRNFPTRSPDPAPAAAGVTLDALRVGEAAVVQEVVGDGPELVRLRVMGVCAGQGVHALRAGPRMIVCVGGTRIGLDRSVAKRVRVQPLTPETAAATVPVVETAPAGLEGGNDADAPAVPNV